MTRWITAMMVALLIVAIGTFATFMVRKPGPSMVVYEQKTFRRGEILGARFALGRNAIVYSAAWEGVPPRIYLATLGNPLHRNLLGADNGVVEAVLPTDEVIFRRAGALESVPVLGGTVRKLCDHVLAADAGPDGQIAIARQVNDKVRVESPIDSPIYTTEWVAPGTLRVSPDGKWIAFFERGAAGSRAFSYDLVVIDVAHAKHVLTRDWTYVQSPAWRPDSREIWFTASQTEGKATELYAVSTSGKLRSLATSPVSFAFDDVSTKGALLHSFNFRNETVAVIGTDEKSLSGSTTVLGDLSRDGKTALLDDINLGRHYTYVRATNGDADPVLLTAAIAIALSPDATSAIAMTDDARQQLLIIPTNGGQPRPLPLGMLEAASWSAAWFPDSKRIVFEGHVHGMPPRIYQQRISGGPITPLSPEGLTLPTLRAVSPDGTWILARAADSTLHLVNVSNRSLSDARGLLPSDVPMQWSRDGREIFVLAKRETCPAKVFRVNPFTGERTFWRDVAPSSCTGVNYIRRIRVSDDETMLVISFVRDYGDLYVATGLR